MANAPLTQEQQERAVRWADEMVAEGHHGRCSSRVSRECDCYFGRSDYVAARFIVEMAAAARELYERVEMDESVGICLSDRVPALRLREFMEAIR